MSEQDKPAPFRGPPSEMAPTGESEEDELRAARIANRFDIRRIIGGLFILYGVILTITGIVGSHAVKNKAAGINIHLGVATAMIIVGAIMIAWALLRRTAPEPTETRGEGSGRIRRAP